MSHNAHPSQEYLKSAVLTAPPEQLQLMLYDGAIKFATRGLEAIRAGDREAAFVALERAQRIVLELSSGLRPEVNPELAGRMAALYGFIHRQLVNANLHQDQQAIEDALHILRHQRETWVMLIDKLRGEAQPPSPPLEPRLEPQAQPYENEPATALNTEG